MKQAPLEKPHDDDWLEDIVAYLSTGKSIRRDLPGGGRLHIDRPLPFLCVHIAEDGGEPVARDIARANASYLIAPHAAPAMVVIEAISAVLRQRFGAFVLFDIGELTQDRFLTDDAPFLPPFEIALWASGDMADSAEIFTKVISDSEAKFRTPRVKRTETPPLREDKVLGRDLHCSTLAVRFAPVYRQPGSAEIYPELREQLVSLLFDAGLRAISRFLEGQKILKPKTHRALGRKTFVDTVTRVDRSIDEVASTFDFLLAVTPINSEAAFQAFKSDGRQPTFLYRPLAFQVEATKRKLFSISFDHLEDPVLYQLYREKQRELDIQLSLLSSRQKPQFVEFGRALYGPVEPSLLDEAKTILAHSSNVSNDDDDDAPEDRIADCFHVERRARTMIAAYRRQLNEFEVAVELRDDLPSGLMVSGHRLLIARSTLMDKRRVEPLLAHEIGVHLLTYFNGSVQGLRLFRSGLAGYEGMQEGLAVFAEYLAGGMTTARLRLIAGRVVGCAAMLDGATFFETYSLLVDDHDFTPRAAFNLALRLYRGGGLAKDAIYLRGLLALLGHLRSGGALEPFWMGKIAASHFEVMQELADRGLLRLPSVRPLFLETDEGRARLARAKNGLRPIEMIQRQET
ncbi:flavohemoglobin expression-modulating QEGLA motif protein [Agrobacterium tumefaciens]|uniref:flavohemoglobin expression-modulating QEGLA motif protein n=1 Tax=Agrobacterium tumefaciens TaxID=358 RepID=UPI00287D8487|nr:flavohemoglobin expression-modulating QEGLA motif protein [Agrobacterium tumefaciens]MDS7594357.1 flavohemoglobin expression-modulating QEGLA motif protein [Agrobacterium tumefaciens]